MPALIQKRLQQIPFLALLLLLFGMQLVFWQECQDPFNAVELAWAKILAPLSVLPLLLSRWPGWRLLLKSRAAQAAAAWLLWMLFSAQASQNPEAASKIAFEFSLYTLLFFVPALLSPAEQRRALIAFFAACMIAGFYGIAQHFGVDPWAWSTDFAGRPLGTLGNPNFFGGHLVMAWGLCLGLLVTAPAGKRFFWAL